MTAPKDRLRGLIDLVCDAVDGVTTLVEDTQDEVADTTVQLISAAAPLAGPVRVVDGARRVGTKLTTTSIKTINNAVRHTAGGATRLLPEVGAVPVRLSSRETLRPGFAADALVGVVNGLVGDHLRARGNGLDLGMTLRCETRYFRPESAAEVLLQATPKLVLFVHGLSATEASWSLFSEAQWGDAHLNYGTLLARDLGYTPVWVRYNSGVHVSENGRALASLLEQLVQYYPTPLQRIALIGHSMGGLVARSACHYASEQALGWLTRLRHVVCLGSPHQGAPLEQAGNVATQLLDAANLPWTRVVSKVARRRSAGIKDLRYGSLVDEDWLGLDPDALREPARREVPLLDHVTYVFLGASLTQDPDHPLGRLMGDLLVRVVSATDHGPERHLGHFSLARTTLGGLSHLHIQNDPRVYEQILRCLSAPLGEAPRGLS